MKIILVAGARPNFMKIAPLMAAFGERPEIEPILVHTGQHYDRAMSDLFFQELGIPEPDVNLGVGGASHAVQTAEIMRAFEPVVFAAVGIPPSRSAAATSRVTDDFPLLPFT